jgi:hypothetical protein
MSTRFDAHIPEESLELYSMGRLPQHEFEEHLLVCPVCEERLTESDRYVRVMREATRRLQTATAKTTPLWNPRMAWGLALAGAIAVIVAVPRFQTTGNPAQEITLSTMRGPDSPGAKAAADRPVTLRIDISNLPSASISALEVVNVSGQVVWQGRAEVRDGILVAPTGRSLDAGQYWVRVYSENPERSLLREFSLLVDR